MEHCSKIVYGNDDDEEEDDDDFIVSKLKLLGTRGTFWVQ